VTAAASITIATPGRIALVNVTADVRQALRRSGLKGGIAIVTVPHTTCGLCINEDEAGLKDDLARLVTHLVDALEQHGPFHHDRVDDNARAHLTAAILGQSATIPVALGELGLGAWQSLFLVELDGPRSRRLDITFLGD
jgi:secondary thiamine-phosphate synthase enzyme